MLMSALSIAYALLCGVLLYCFFWTLSYCRGIVLQHCKHLGLESHRPHTNFIVILLFSKQKPKSVSKTVSHRARFVSPAHIRQGILGSLSLLLPVSLVFLSMVCLVLGEGRAWKRGGKNEKGRGGYQVSSWTNPGKPNYSVGFLFWLLSCAETYSYSIDSSLKGFPRLCNGTLKTVDNDI